MVQVSARSRVAPKGRTCEYGVSLHCTDNAPLLKSKLIEIMLQYSQLEK